MKEEPQSEAQDASAIDRASLQREAAMLRDFMLHPGWAWLSTRMQKSRKAWETAVMEAVPVGEGAAKLARAQGAFLALRQFMELPVNTATAIERYLAGDGRPPEDA